MTSQGAIDADDVTLCMIIYNEERFLEQTLLAIRDYFPRFSILDMGSMDRSLAIIQDLLQGAASIIHWQRHQLFSSGFGAARNAVSDVANSPWLLHVDADEVLTGIDGSRVIGLSGDESSSLAWKIRRRNLTGAEAPKSASVECLTSFEASSIEHHVRLFRSSSRCRWIGYLHEMLTIDGRLASTVALEAYLNLEHLSFFRPESEKIAKESLYAWMLLQAYSNPTTYSLAPEYIGHVEKNIGWLKPLAIEFGSNNSLEMNWDLSRLNV